MFLWWIALSRVGLDTVLWCIGHMWGKDKKGCNLIVKIKIAHGLFSTSAAVWWLKEIIKSRNLQVNSISQRAKGCSDLLFCTIALFTNQGEHCLTTGRSIQAESLRQVSCPELCQHEFLQCLLGCCGVNVANKRPGFRLIKIVWVLRAGPLLSKKFLVPH